MRGLPLQFWNCLLENDQHHSFIRRMAKYRHHGHLLSFFLRARVRVDEAEDQEVQDCRVGSGEE